MPDLSLLDPARISADLDRLLQEGGRKVELAGAWVAVPATAALTVLARSYHQWHVPVGFGNHYRALIAVGGVRGIENGFVEAGICFATLYYSEEKKLITADFSAELP